MECLPACINWSHVTSFTFQLQTKHHYSCTVICYIINTGENATQSTNKRKCMCVQQMPLLLLWCSFHISNRTWIYQFTASHFMMPRSVKIVLYLFRLSLILIESLLSSHLKYTPSPFNKKHNIPSLIVFQAKSYCVNQPSLNFSMILEMTEVLLTLLLPPLVNCLPFASEVAVTTMTQTHKVFVCIIHVLKTETQEKRKSLTL